MAELTAYMPAVEAYAVWDRMTRMAWKVKAAEAQATHVGAADGIVSDESDTDSDDSATDSGDVHATATVPETGATENVSQRAGTDTDNVAVTDTDTDTDTNSSSEAKDHVRGLDEIRTDVFADLLTAGTPSEELAGIGLGAIQGRVQVTVPKRHVIAGRNLASPSPGAGHLIGYGPIDLETTRELAGHATSWDEAHIDPIHGTVLTVTSYQPSQAQRRYLRIRDSFCRFPGCRAPVTRCDIDHTIAAAEGGPTSSTNLAHLCRPHHRMKHHTNWSVKQLSGGIMKWVSPTGRTHYDKPASRVMFHDIGDLSVEDSTVSNRSDGSTSDGNSNADSIGDDPRVTTRAGLARHRESAAQRRRKVEGEAPTAQERRARILQKYRSTASTGDGEAGTGAETQPF